MLEALIDSEVRAYLPSSFLPMMIQVMSVILHGF